MLKIIIKPHFPFSQKIPLVFYAIEKQDWVHFPNYKSSIIIPVDHSSCSLNFVSRPLGFCMTFLQVIHYEAIHYVHVGHSYRPFTMFLQDIHVGHSLRQCRRFLQAIHHICIGYSCRTFLLAIHYVHSFNLNLLLMFIQGILVGLSIHRYQVDSFTLKFDDISGRSSSSSWAVKAYRNENA